MDEILVETQLVKDNLVRSIITSEGSRRLREVGSHLFVMVYAKQLITTTEKLNFASPPTILWVLSATAFPKESILENDLSICPNY